MFGVERAGDAVERSRPVGLELLIHQPLRKLRVAEPGEAVVYALEVVLPSAQQLPRQPLPPIDANLDVEREPRLDASVHEPEEWIKPVVVEMKTLAWSGLESPLIAIG